MKTKEEIEQLALQRFPIEMVVIFSKRDKVDKNKERRKIFIETYTQCQENMADKKYTEEDIRKAFKFYAYAHISQQPHSYEKLEQDYLQFINSLNKQD